MALTLTDGRYAVVEAILNSGNVQVGFYANADSRTRFKEGTQTPFETSLSSIFTPVKVVTNEDGTSTDTPVTTSATLADIAPFNAVKTVGYDILKQLPEFYGAIDC